MSTFKVILLVEFGVFLCWFAWLLWETMQIGKTMRDVEYQLSELVQAIRVHGGN